MPTNPSAFMRAVGLQLDEVGPQRVTGWLDLGPEHHQPTGIVHRGVYASVVEEVGSHGAYVAAAVHGHGAVGVANFTNFVRPIRSGRVRVVGTPVHQGRTQQVWEVRVTQDEDGKLVAFGQLRVQHVDLEPPGG